MESYSNISTSKSPVTSKRISPPDEQFQQVLNHLQEENEQYSQHHSAIKKLFTERPNGFYANEIGQVYQIVDHCIKFIEKGREEYLEVLEQMLDVCGKPIQLRKTTDALLRKEALIALLNSVSRIMRLPLTNTSVLKTKAANCLMVIIKHESNADIIKFCVEKCIIVNALNDELGSHLNNDDPDYNTLLLITLQLIKLISTFESCTTEFTSGNASAASSSLSVDGGMDKLITLIERNDFKSEVVPLCVDILWNILEKYPTARDILGSFRTIKVFKETIYKMLEHGYRAKDKELRNDILVLVTFLCERNGTQQHFLDTGLLDLLCTYSIITDIQENNNETIKQYVESLEILFVLAVRSPNEFSKNGGPEIVLNFATNAKTEALLNVSLAVLFNAATTPTGISDLSETDCIQIMLHIMDNKQTSWASKRDALHVICSLCVGDPRNKEVFGTHNGVKMLVTLFENFKPSKTVEFEEFHFIVADSLWCCVSGNPKNVAYFIELDGVYYLMDILEKCTDWIKTIMLSCLIDLISENAEVIDEIRRWKSGISSFNAAQLLISLWKKQQLNKLEGTQFVSKDKLEFKVKVYHVFHLIGFDGHQLSYEEQLVLAEIKEYRNILIDGVWHDIQAALEQEGVRPTTPDQQMIEEKMNISLDRKKSIDDEQTNVLQTRKMDEMKDEQEFYNTIHAKKQKQKVIKYKPSISIIEQKKRKAEMLKKSFKSANQKSQNRVEIATPEPKKDKMWTPPPGSPLLSMSPKLDK